MTRTTSQLRDLWSPPCEGPWARLVLYGEGVVSVDPLIVPAVRAISAVFEHFGYRTRRKDSGAYNCRRITNGSGFSLHAYGIAIDVNWQSNPYGPRLVTDMAPPYDMIEAIEAIRTVGGVVVWRWGGRYRGNKDAMHFEVVASPAELARGIDARTLPGGTRPPNPTPQPDDSEERELMAAKDDIEKAIEQKGNDLAAFLTQVVADVEKRLNAKLDRLATKAAVVRRKGDGAVFVVSDSGKTHVQKEELNLLLFLGLVAPWPGAAKGTSTIPVVDDSWLDGLPEVAELRAEIDALTAENAPAPEAQKPEGTTKKAAAKAAAATKAAAPKPE